MKCALLIAFQFPPFKASSGLERVLSLVRHLPAQGWEPLVLTASPSAYPAVSDERISAVPAHTVVRRPLALDAARHLAFRGRYFAALAKPDRWWTWSATAVPAGLGMIRRFKPSVLFSTYPIATTHRLAYLLHRLSGVPWVADFRDPMVEFDARSQQWFPADSTLRNQRLAIEHNVAHHAAAASFCTAGARDIFAGRHGQDWHQKSHVIANGFDEDVFATLGAAPSHPAPATAARPITLLHSGTIYPSPDRDPSIFLRALAKVVSTRAPAARPLQVVLRGSGVESLYLGLIAELGLEAVVSFAPIVAYQDALREMMAADGLLILQGHTSNPAIPAKLYEYFRSGRPILALVDEAGETARCLRQQRVGLRAALDDEAAIRIALQGWLEGIENGQARGMGLQSAMHFERRTAVQQFAEVFGAVSN